ncbi:right-handed parallel beta-helix repeat-containing protein [Jiangella muralis]|uniref:right-handed parallel beta-helix repeat-containing protein n=1 Tax=Jiangella muralis TaxID=702383 RepID=UPI00069CE0F2|nr:right-handed parallel beta-helix repeat-containing protein [Jiangella muralis]
MPKYARSPARRTRRKIVVATTLVATVLVGGALASNALQSNDGTPQAIADDTVSNVRLAGKSENRPEKVERGHKWGWHKIERPTPTPTPTPTPEETASAEPEPEPTETEEPEETQPPETEQPSTPENNGPFPTLESTGPRTSDLKPSKGITTSEDGQVIEGLEVSSGIKVVNDDVTIRDVRLVFDAKYGLHIAKKNDGTCPQNVVIEYVEVTGTSQLDDESIAVYSPCPYTLRNSSVHEVGSAVRITNGTVITGNYIHANHYIPNSGAHRSAIGLNGGGDHTITNNTVDCEGPGCSGALVMYGDFSPVENVLIEHNLLNTTGSYCTYGGSVDSKKYPTASNVRYVDNQFGRKYSSECGKYGPLTAWNGGNGNEWSGNVWADTGQPVGG